MTGVAMERSNACATPSENMRDNALCLIRFLTWAQDELTYSVPDKFAAYNIDAIISHLQRRFEISDAEIHEPPPPAVD